MAYSVAPLERLIEHFASMQGIGRKTAQRMAFEVLALSEEDAARFADDIRDARKNIKYCHICQNLSAQETCTICSNPLREPCTICVVEDVKAVMAIEKTESYEGVYHVLHGTISPMEGIGPDPLKIKELLARITPQTQEVILATNPTVEGDATALYLSRLLKPMGVKVTRLAYGIPVGGDLEYADEVTLSRAMSGRSEL